MSDKENQKLSDAKQRERMYKELLDSFDEELEMEFDDERLSTLISEIGEASESPLDERNELKRGLYFKELFRLQGELVKLQDWVVHKKLKVVVLFEGRDAAGKGGSSSASPNASIPGCAALPR